MSTHRREDRESASGLSGHQLCDDNNKITESSQLETRPVLSLPSISLPHYPMHYILTLGSFRSPTKASYLPVSLPFQKPSDGSKLGDMLGMREMAT